MPKNTMNLLNAKILTMLAILEIRVLMMILTVGNCFRKSTLAECLKCKWMIALNFMSKNDHININAHEASYTYDNESNVTVTFNLKIRFFIIS